MRNRKACCCGCGKRAADARHDLVVDAGLVQRLRLLRAAAEDKRIAALQTHDQLAGLAVLDEARVDLILRHRNIARRLACVDQHAARLRLKWQLVACETIEHEHVGAPHEIEPAYGNQPRVSRAGADKEDRHAAPSVSNSRPPSASN